MIIYNITTNIHESVHDQWLKWMQEKHIPEILATEKFSSARIVKVLVEEEMGGITYSVQYTTDSKILLRNIIWKINQNLTEKLWSYLRTKCFLLEQNWRLFQNIKEE